ncbi:MAG TPA: hypothetical protein P5287_05085 [bacterium]|nr:hypothetical protein [bacterium]
MKKLLVILVLTAFAGSCAIAADTSVPAPAKVKSFKKETKVKKTKKNL